MGKGRELYVEVVRLTEDGRFLSSSVRPATEADIKKFKSKPCNHDIRVDKLIWDEPAGYYDRRNCGVCGCFVDYI